MPVIPSISDVESSSNELKEDDSEQQEGSQSPPSLGLPGTVVQGGGADQPESEACPAQKKVDEAVEEQEDLLAEFAKVADELKKLLGDLEGSTFVKRLKAASRRQMAVAAELNESVESGLRHQPVSSRGAGRRPAGENVAKREIAHGDDVYVIQDDLEAYFNRVQEGKFKTVVTK